MKYALLTLTALLLVPQAALRAGDTPTKPNILWLVSEDNDTFLGCYGDAAGEDADARQVGTRGRVVRALLRLAGLRAVAVRAHHGHVCGHLRSGGAHAGAGQDPIVAERVSRLPACGGLLYVEQRQDRLQLAHQHPGSVERVQREGPLAQPRRGPAVLQRVQPRGHARELPVPEERAAVAFPAYGPGQSTHSALSARHARDAGRLGAVLQPHGAAGRPDRRQTQGPCRRRAGRRHDRVLLLRQWRRAAAQQAVPPGKRHACSADRLFPAEVAASRAGAARFADQGAGQFRGFRARRCSRWPA